MKRPGRRLAEPHPVVHQRGHTVSIRSAELLGQRHHVRRVGGRDPVPRALRVLNAPVQPEPDIAQLRRWRDPRRDPRPGPPQGPGGPGAVHLRRVVPVAVEHPQHGLRLHGHQPSGLRVHDRVGHLEPVPRLVLAFGRPVEHHLHAVQRRPLQLALLGRQLLDRGHGVVGGHVQPGGTPVAGHHLHAAASRGVHLRVLGALGIQQGPGHRPPRLVGDQEVVPRSVVGWAGPGLGEAHVAQRRLASVVHRHSPARQHPIQDHRSTDPEPIQAGIVWRVPGQIDGFAVRRVGDLDLDQAPAGAAHEAAGLQLAFVDGEVEVPQGLGLPAQQLVARLQVEQGHEAHPEDGLQVVGLRRAFEVESQADPAVVHEEPVGICTVEPTHGRVDIGARRPGLGRDLHDVVGFGEPVLAAGQVPGVAGHPAVAPPGRRVAGDDRGLDLGEKVLEGLHGDVRRRRGSELGGGPPDGAGIPVQVSHPERAVQAALGAGPAEPRAAEVAGLRVLRIHDVGVIGPVVVEQGVAQAQVGQVGAGGAVAERGPERAVRGEGPCLGRLAVQVVVAGNDLVLDHRIGRREPPVDPAVEQRARSVVEAEPQERGGGPRRGAVLLQDRADVDHGRAGEVAELVRRPRLRVRSALVLLQVARLHANRGLQRLLSLDDPEVCVPVVTQHATAGGPGWDQAVAKHVVVVGLRLQDRAVLAPPGAVHLKDVGEAAEQPAGVMDGGEPVGHPAGVVVDGGCQTERRLRPGQHGPAVGEEHPDPALRPRHLGGQQEREGTLENGLGIELAGYGQLDAVVVDHHGQQVLGDVAGGDPQQGRQLGQVEGDEHGEPLPLGARLGARDHDHGVGNVGLSGAIPS